MPAARRSSSYRSSLYTAAQQLPLREEHLFRRRLARAHKDSSLAAIEKDLHQRIAHYTALFESFPQNITFPEELPITDRLDDVRQALEQHNVVIVAGETGSGKTTQLPKLCLSMGRGRRGRIGHTQPRRIAARSVAERIAGELGVAMGDTVGYAVRFTDNVSDATAIKVMTDGILLAEIHHDRLLQSYDTIIIDEAHERSLNIDFLLGYLTKILPQRPDLKVIITSATIATERFAQHFELHGISAPVIEVSGRLFPVDIRYRPAEGDSDPLTHFVEAVTELYTESHTEGGDILAFFPGEREIREAMTAVSPRVFPDLEVLPLYGRLSAAEQHRIFEHHGRQRLILATNVAETSLTVPGIRYVIDTGTARISRYSRRGKIQRLPIEPISQASAQQRSGRCGRLGDGIALRLYSEEDFAERPLYTEPEILRTNLSSVILRMMDLGLGTCADFPFLDPPELSAVRDGIVVLQELGALNEDERLTSTGRTMARIPLDPRLARMLVEAQRRSVLGSALIIIAGLALQDIRERPTEHQQEADLAHKRFHCPHSDFLSYLRLWNYLHTRSAELSRRQFRALCTQEYIHWLRYREWCDLVHQLEDIARQHGWTWTPHSLTGEAPEEALHLTILSGVLSHIGVRRTQSREYQGTRGTSFFLFPGSGVSGRADMVMSYEMVETSQVWARTVARIEPEWVEKIAGPLVRRRHDHYVWSERRGEACCHEYTSLWGVPLVQDRRISLHKIDRAAARDLFIAHALVGGEWKSHYGFLDHNAAKLAELQQWEEKTRHRGIAIDEDALAALYSEVIPENVCSEQTFARWWKKLSRDQRRALQFTQDQVLAQRGHRHQENLFPEVLAGYPLTYSFQPGTEEDGISWHLPANSLSQCDPTLATWLVPGLRHELLVETLRRLPKDLRRRCIPLQETTAQLLDQLPSTPPPGISWGVAVSQALSRHLRLSLPDDLCEDMQLPRHLRMRFVVCDADSGKPLDSDRSWAALLRRHTQTISTAVQNTFVDDVSQKVYDAWTESVGDIPQTLRRGKVTGYPALAPNGTGWSIRVFPTAAAAHNSQLSSIIALFLKALPGPEKRLFSSLPAATQLSLRSYPGGDSALKEDTHHSAVRDLIIMSGGPVWTYEGYQSLLRKVREQLPSRRRQSARIAAEAVHARNLCLAALPQGQGITEDIRESVEWLTDSGFLFRYGVGRARHFPRYIRAAQERLSKACCRNGYWEDPHGQAYDEFYALEDAYFRLEDQRGLTPEVKKIRWLLEEYKVSLFAQHLGTAEKISATKLRQALKATDSRVLHEEP